MKSLRRQPCAKPSMGLSILQKHKVMLGKLEPHSELLTELGPESLSGHQPTHPRQPPLPKWGLGKDFSLHFNKNFTRMFISSRRGAWELGWGGGRGGEACPGQGGRLLPILLSETSFLSFLQLN